MLEMIINPKKTTEHPFKMFFVGIVYASLSLILVHWFFSSDPALSDASGMLVVLFCVMFTLPFLYFMIKNEERKDEAVEGFITVWNTHEKAILTFLWLFMGFIVAFSFWFIVLQDSSLFNFQIETYCRINSYDVENCIKESYFTGDVISAGATFSSTERFFSILENNVFVMIFTLIFSLIFGAGAIFILAWNASVIAAAIGIFTNYSVSEIPIGIIRYMIHGLPEIAAYFITALAGGIIGVGVIRHGVADRRFLHVLKNSIILIFVSIIILMLAAFVEVYFTPILVS